MARIPIQLASRGLETGPTVNYSGVASSPVGQALEGVGNAIEGTAGALYAQQERYRQQVEETENFEATQNFNQFKIAANGDLSEIDTKTPASGLGFHDNAMGAFEKRKSEFLTTVPERLRGRFTSLLDTEQAQFSQQQAEVELTKRNGWYRTGLEKALGRGQEQVYNNPGNLEAAKQEAIRDIDASGLPEAEKTEWREKVEQGLAVSLAARTMEESPDVLAGSLGVAVQPLPSSDGTVVLPADPSLPAGMRNNNPGNIKFVGQSRDQGVLGPSKNTDQGDPQAVFETPEAGMAALYRLAVKKYDGGKVTANSLIAGQGGWTPGNKQAAANVASAMGLSADDDLDLKNPSRAAAFIRGLLRQEHGSASDAYPDSLIQSVVDAGGVAARVASAASPALQSHLKVAAAFLGASEGKDGGAIAEFIKKSAGIDIDPRQTAWCAAYVNAVLGSQGVQGNGSLAARSFLDFGDAVDRPTPGDIVVLSRGSDPSKGHVGFFAGYGPNGQVKVLGGNQSNAVTVANYDQRSVLAFRRPPNVGDVGAANERLARLPGGGPSGGMVVTDLDPRFASLPFADRLKLASQARQQVQQRQQVAQTQQKAQYTAYNDSVNLGILTGQVSSEEQILNDPVLDDGDKSSRLTQFRAQVEKNAATGSALQDYLSGGLTDLNPLDSDQRKTANAVYDKIATGIEGQPDEVKQAQTQAFIKQTSIIPDPVQAELRRGVYSTNPQEFAGAMDAAGRIEDTAPIAFDSMPSGEDLRRDLTSYRYMVNDLGLASQDAAKRLIDRRSPEFKRNEEVLGPAADKAVKDLELSDATDAFDPGFFSSEPGGGADPTTKNALLAEYREAFKDQFIRTGGDEGEAKKLAAEDLKKTWGISTISGDAQLMKFPPEKFYPALDGGFDYLKDDATATAKEMADGDVSGVFLRPSPATAADIRAGRQPRYRLFYTRDVNGQPVIDEVPGLWAMDSASIAERQAASKAANMTAAEDRRRVIEDAQAFPQRTGAAILDRMGAVKGAVTGAMAQPAPTPEQQRATIRSRLPSVSIVGQAGAAELPSSPAVPNSREAIAERLRQQRQELLDANR